ncbi:MAG: hypothetical protein RQ751_07165, partial [Longimicrobiales bacterium]|nr:hypothetical protein [Longimicrobiales bacterium]
VVPRRPERFEEVAALAPWVRRSRGGERELGAVGERGGALAPDLFLLDAMGEAEAAVALADVVVLGRSYARMGGSNPAPAALLGRPLVVGPNYGNFREMVAALTDAGAAVVAPEPWPAVARILRDPEVRAAMERAGPAVVAASAGAAGRTLEVVRRQLTGYPWGRTPPGGSGA